MIYNLFSKREKQKRGEIPDVYQYTDIPEPLRVQIVHILLDALGSLNGRESLYENMHSILCREYGLFSLSKEAKTLDFQSAVFNFMIKNEDVEQVLDVIEVGMFLALTYTQSRAYYINPYGIKMDVNDAIKELNKRLQYHGVGFQYESGKMIRIDSKIIHSEVVKPVLTLLSEKEFVGANEEFLKAFEHYRHGRSKECLNECLKAFESTMKTICTLRGWTYNTRDTARNLIEVCFSKGLIP